MAITILQYPQSYQPVYNQIMVVLESTESNSTDFNYIIDIKDGSSNLLIRLKILPDPNGRCIVDVHKHLEQLVSYDLDINSTEIGIYNNPSNTFKSYIISTAEEFLFGGTQTEFAGPSFGAFVFNGVVGWVEQSDYKWTDYTTGFNGVGKLLTSLPTRGYEVELDSKFYLNIPDPFDYFIYTTNGRLEIKAYNNSGLDWQENIVTAATENTLALGPANINTATDMSGTNFIDETTKYYTVQLKGDASTSSGIPGAFLDDLTQTSATTATFTGVNLSPTNGKINDTITLSGFLPSGWDGTYTITDGYYLPTGGYEYEITKGSVPAGSPSTIGTYGVASAGVESLLYRINVDSECSMYEKYQLIFLDRLGSFISIMFNRASSKSGRVRKDFYTKNIGSFSGDRWSYSSTDRSITRLDTIVKEKTSVTSNWISEEQSALIDEMIASPIVFHLDEDGNLLPIDITTTNYKEKKRITDKLFNYKIEFEYTFLDPQQK